MNKKIIEKIQQEVNFVWGHNLYANILAFWKIGDYFYYSVGVWANKDQSLDFIDINHGCNISHVIMKFDENYKHIQTIDF